MAYDFEIARASKHMVENMIVVKPIGVTGVMSQTTDGCMNILTEHATELQQERSVPDFNSAGDCMSTKAGSSKELLLQDHTCTEDQFAAKPLC